MNPMKRIVDRFLSWQLPKDFSPDAGISFKPTKPDGYGTHWWPIGTNLFTADQAEEMLKYVLSDAIAIVELTEQEINDFKSQESIIAAERAVSDKLLEALKLAKSIIGHPDDSGSILIANTIAEVEAMRKGETE